MSRTRSDHSAFTLRRVFHTLIAIVGGAFQYLLQSFHKSSSSRHSNLGHVFPCQTLWSRKPHKDNATELARSSTLVLVNKTIRNNTQAVDDLYGHRFEKIGRTVNAQNPARKMATRVVIEIATTVFGLVDSPAFSPTTSTRWINTLFFFSLVLSLAAALFGILAKQ